MNIDDRVEFKASLAETHKDAHIRFCLFLTASIDPKGCWYLKRSDPKVRERDYIDSLKKWLRKTDYPIVFCENSNYDLSKIIKITELFVKSGRKIEFIQFSGNDYLRSLGKGYGEGLVIKYAIEHSKLLSQYDYIIKVTGRTFVDNIKSSIRFLELNPDIAVMHDRKVIWEGKHQIASRIFIAKLKFIRDYLLKYLGTVNDEANFYLEHALYNSVTDAVKDGSREACFKEKPHLVGRSGTYDEDLNPSPMRSAVRNFKVAVRRFGRYLLRSGA